ncbi:hypothetical protein OAG68_02760 [bacterium]|nr:hypothetical protein [bacterium]
MITVSVFSGSVVVTILRRGNTLRISGLSNQWKSRDGLFRRFAHIDPDFAIVSLPSWAQKFCMLVHELESLTGPDLFIGSSLACMNFNTRDTKSRDDNVPSFAYVEILEDKSSGEMYYQIAKRQICGVRPTTDWKNEITDKPDVAARLIREAADYADSPVRRVK